MTNKNNDVGEKDYEDICTNSEEQIFQLAQKKCASKPEQVIDIYKTYIKNICRALLRNEDDIIKKVLLKQVKLESLV